MGGHVYARISGHGLTIIPRVPFRYERLADGLRLAHESPQGLRSVLLDRRGNVTLEGATAALEEVADVVDGPALADWRIESSTFTASWPEGFALYSRSKSPGYELVGDGGTLVFPQGPLEGPLPPDERFAAPGQRIVATGVFADSIRAIELAYEHEGQEWTQRHYFVPFGRRTIIVTAQAVARLGNALAPIAERFALSIEPFEGDARSLDELRKDRS
jgi:hypothetical protein